MYEKNPAELRTLLQASAQQAFTSATLDTILSLVGGIGGDAGQAVKVDDATILHDARVAAGAGAQVLFLHVDGPAGTEAAITQSIPVTILSSSSGAGVSAFFREASKLDQVSSSQGMRAVLGSSGNDSITLADRHLSYVDGGAGDDLLVAGDGAAFLIGGEGDDTLLGGRGDDTLVAGIGNDVIDGGAGFNVAAFAGKLERMDISIGAGHVRVTNIDTHAVTELTHVAVLRFDDYAVLVQTVGYLKIADLPD